MARKLTALLLCAVMLAFTGCVTQLAKELSTDEVIPAKLVMEAVTDLQAENLRKLCKVWGYIKYSHPDFILGRRDWDLDLLTLIPVVYAADNPSEVNDILETWVFGLNSHWYKEVTTSFTWDSMGEEYRQYQADTDWLDDQDYLGAALAAKLPKFRRVPARNRSKAPVYFSYSSFSDFSNEKSYEDMDYSDGRFRLLGLFRLWNAIEYYFPYLDIMDDNWNDLLLEYIPLILQGTDKQSYELTLAALSAKLHDGHIGFTDMTFLFNEFGYFKAPVELIKADGRQAVKEIINGYEDICALRPGDVILAMDGVAIEDVIADRVRYLSVPNNDKLKMLYFGILLRSHNETAEITVLRDGEEITLEVIMHRTITYPEDTMLSHEILEGNIGLINPAAFKTGELPEIMTNLADTVGLIVDLRQYPGGSLTYELADYLVGKYMASAIPAYPSQVVPGAFYTDKPMFAGGLISDEVYYYDKPVVVLMDEHTQSNAEFTVMALRNGSNVTVMGDNSIGADGNVTYLPLPGGNTFRFTGLGVYTPEGGQTQRIGLTPDIYIEQTAAALKEGRDEYIEAAIEHIIEQLK